MSSVVAAARWESYAVSTRGEHFAWWCELHCIQSVDRFAGLPLALEDWQFEMMCEALAEEAEDVAYWQTVVLVLPKGNGKTSLLGAYSLYELHENEGAPEILLAAATDKQAGRLFDCGKRFVYSDPWLGGRSVVREHEGQITRIGSFGTLYRVSGDSGAAAGYNPSLVVADELAEWNTPRRRRTWADIATAGELKREQSRVFVISTAGEPHERISGILGQLIDTNERVGEVERVHQALTVSRDHQSRTLVYNYDAGTLDVDDLDAIRAANPATWISTDRLRALSHSPKLSAGRFLQLHGCVWTSAAGTFLTVDEWRALEIDDQLEPSDEITIGFRGGDGWALVACRRRDGLLVPLATAEVHGPPDRETVDAALQYAAATYRIASVFAAPTPEWRSLVDDWRRDLGRKRVIDVRVDLPSPRTDQIVKRFRADAQAAELLHHPNDPRLSAPILAARIAIARGNVYLTPDSQHPASIAGALAAVLSWEAHAVTPASPPPGLPGEVADYRIRPL